MTFTTIQSDMAMSLALWITAQVPGDRVRSPSSTVPPRPQICSLYHVLASEPPLKQVAAALMPPVRRLRVNAIELPHAFGQIVLRGSHYQW